MTRRRTVRRTHPALAALQLAGLAAGLMALFAVTRPGNQPHWYDLVVMTGTFTLLAFWTLRLPSGVSIHPAMAIGLASMYLLPRELTIAVPVLGLVLASLVERRRLPDLLLVMGHFLVPLFCAAWVYSLAGPGQLRLPDMLPAAILAIAVHRVLNRVLSAMILCVREQRPYWGQLVRTMRDPIWLMVGVDFLSITLIMAYRSSGLWGLGLETTLLAGVYLSISLYTRMTIYQEASMTDGLTGARNRTAWEEFRESSGGQVAPGTLVVFDMNGFKAVNDRYGHTAGDRILREFVAGLSSTLRGSDLIFRYGGDEFVAYLPQGRSGSNSAKARITRLVAELEESWQQQGLQVSISVGLAALPGDGGTPAEVFRVADERMYAAKHQHKLTR